MFNRQITSTFILMFLVCTLFAPKALAWSILPTKVEREANGGSTFTELFTLDNQESSEPRRFEVALVDWHLNDKGDLAFTKPGEYEWGLMQYGTVSPQQFSVGPGDHREVRVTVKLPEGMKPGEYVAGLYVTERTIHKLPPQVQGKITLNFNVVYSYLAQMVVTIGAKKEVKVEPVGMKLIDATSATPAVLELTLHNSGDYRAKPIVSFDLVDPAGTAVFQQAPQTVNILRSSDRVVTFTLPPGVSGDFKAVAKIDQGKEFPLGEVEKTFTVSKVAPAPPPAANATPAGPAPTNVNVQLHPGKSPVVTPVQPAAPKGK